jgi:DNA-binding CsgD family transcriptional regulator
LLPAVEKITSSLGFDTFTAGVSISRRPGGETLSYVFTTLPSQWVAIYDQKSFIEFDPRIQTLLRTGLPVIWDQNTFDRSIPGAATFLETALNYGVGSGVAVGLADLKGHAATLALNSRAGLMNEQRRAQIQSAIGDIVFLAHFFHELFVGGMVNSHVRPRSEGAPLSPREIECLRLSAHGLTSDDIAFKLNITARTVQFHFDSIRAKLAAATRQEAIAKAMQAGILTDQF